MALLLILLGVFVWGAVKSQGSGRAKHGGGVSYRWVKGMAREMGSTHPHYHHKHLKAYGQVSKYGHWR